MKKTLVLLAVSILILLCAAGQAQDRQLLKVSVPFSFRVQNTVLPPGTYTVYRLNPFNILRVMSADGRHVATVSFTSGKTSDSSLAGAIFRRIEGQYFLAELREQGNGMEREVSLGKHAEELAKNHDTVMISAR